MFPIRNKWWLYPVAFVILLSLCGVAFLIYKDPPPAESEPRTSSTQSPFAPNTKTDISARKRLKRWTDIHPDDWTWLDSDKDHPHFTNMWFRYAAFLANYTKAGNCYVCSKMPHSVTQVKLDAKALSDEDAACVLGYCCVMSPLECSRKVKHTRKTNLSEWAVTLIDSTQFTCPNTTRDFQVNLDVPMKKMTNVLLLPTFHKQQCSTRIVEGMLQDSAWGKNQQRGNESETFKTKVPFCLLKTDGDVAVGDVTVQAHCCVTFNVSYAWDNLQWIHPVRDIWWLCGRTAYVTPPNGWTGTCAPVTLTDHTYIVKTELDDVKPKRTKRSYLSYEDFKFKPHDSQSGSNVPDDHKIWTVGQKVVLSLFSPVGVGKLLLRLETVNYEFRVFANVTLGILDKLSEEMKAIRAMVLQNRMVLDLITAKEGGVCEMVSKEVCCAYLPDNTDDIDKGLAVLRQLKGAMDADEMRPKDTWDAFNWFQSGTWYQILMKILTPIFFVILIVMILVLCVLPCLRALMNRMIAHVFVMQAHVLFRDERLIGEEEDAF